MVQRASARRTNSTLDDRGRGPCVVVGLGFHADESAVLAQAAWLSRQLDARLHLAHVVEDDRPLGFASAGSDLDAEQRLMSLASALGEDGVRCQTALLRGRPSTELAAYAGQRGAVMVMVGSESRRRWRSYFRGGTATELMRNSAAPVWVAPSFASEPRSVHRVAVALPLSPAGGCEAVDLGLLDVGCDVARQLGAALEVLHVVDCWRPPFAALQSDERSLLDEATAQARRRVDRHLAGLRMGETPVRILHGSPALELREHVLDQRVDLLVMGLGAAGALPALLGSTTEHLLTDPPCPIVYPGQRSWSNAYELEPSAIRSLMSSMT